MRNRRLAFPLLLSFNEFAWIVAFFVALFHFSRAQEWSLALEKSQTGQGIAEQELASVRARFAHECASSMKLEENIALREQALAVLEAKICQIQVANLRLAKESTEIQEELRKERNREPGIRKEIVGLAGEFRRVAILFDRSGSMSNGNRWNHARDVVGTWLRYLNIQQCILITFASDVDVFPADRRFLVTQGTDEATNAQNRRTLIAHLAGMSPAGGTDTAAALQKAYEFRDREGNRIDTILLFTDGGPNDGESAGFDPAVALRIYELVREHPDIPVNSIGLGAYFEGNLGGFLLNVAALTKGGFLGR